jgi:hypothetical protein
MLVRARARGAMNPGDLLQAAFILFVAAPVVAAILARRV